MLATLACTKTTLIILSITSLFALPGQNLTGEEEDNGGRLQQIRDEVGQENESQATPAGRPHQHAPPPTTTQSSAQANMEFFATVMAGFDAFHTSSYPYSDSDGWQGSHAPSGTPTSSWAARGRVAYGHIDSDLWRIGAEVAITAGAYEVRWEWSEFHERSASDQLLISSFDIMAAFPLIDHHLRAGFGAGMTWLDAPGTSSDFGVQVSALVQWFPQRPWVVESYGAYGSVGDASHYRLQTHVGVQVWRCTISAGYDYRTVGSVDLSGPSAGVSIWF
ncbi:MAG: hypothetical protein EA401_12410 [Planctomycetota bacterium]|nr:MAG: hypothetical protein EA401_12410 [Planctomycetota bacterium]